MEFLLILEKYKILIGSIIGLKIFNELLKIDYSFLVKKEVKNKLVYKGIRKVVYKYIHDKFGCLVEILDFYNFDIKKDEFSLMITVKYNNYITNINLLGYQKDGKIFLKNV